jgi:hypothetical protein
MHRWAVAILLLTASPALALAQDKKFSIKTATNEPPKELNESIRKLLANKTVVLYDPAGTAICELWFTKQLSSDATAEQVKNGLTYRELKETSVIGAVRFDDAWTDYRKQKIKSGVYTLRLGFQPMDGDHQGKSAFTEFILLVAAAKDTDPETMSPKGLMELSMRSNALGHPCVLMLFPITKAPAMPKLEETAPVAGMPKDHWVLEIARPVMAGGSKASIGFGITLVGEAAE